MASEREQLILSAIAQLPSVYIDEITAGSQDSCPICLQDFASIFQHDPHDVTKVAACNHLFCKKDLAEWIRNLHGSCPTCRHPFLDVAPVSDDDDESSDGGEYIPVDVDMEDDEPLDESFLISEPDLEDDGFDLEQYIQDGHPAPTAYADYEESEFDWEADASSSMDEGDASPSTPSDISFPSDANVPSPVDAIDEIPEAVQVEVGSFDEEGPDDLRTPPEQEQK